MACVADDVHRKPTGDEVDWEDRRSGGIEVTAGRMPALPGKGPRVKANCRATRLKAAKGERE